MDDSRDKGESILTDMKHRVRHKRACAIRKIATLAIILASQAAFAEPVSTPVYIKVLRPYGGGVNVYVDIDGTFCGTNGFIIDTSVQNGKEMYAAALTAFSMNLPVRLEANNATGCAGWGTKLQSIYLER